MKNSVTKHAAALLIAVAGATTAYAITEAQSHVIPVLEALKLQPVKSDVIGGPQKFKVTKATLDHLKKVMDDGKVIVVENDGSIKVE